MRWAKRVQRAGSRQRDAVFPEFFHVDAQLDRMAAGRGCGTVAKAEFIQRGAAGKRQLDTHQVDTGDRFGDGVLDLQARIRLDEVERRRLAQVRAVHQEFEGADVVVAGRIGQGHGGVQDLGSQARRQLRRRRDFHDLLMPTLDAAIALAQVADVAVAVAHHLHLDMQGPLDQPFGVKRPRSKRRLCLCRCAYQGLGDVLLAFDDAHAASAAPDNGFQDHGAVRLQAFVERHSLVGIGDDGRCGQHGQAIGGSEVSCLDLVPEQAQYVLARSDEDNAGCFAGGREIGVLREEPVSRMNRVAALVLRDRDDLFDVEISRGASARELDGLVHRVGMQGVLVVGGMDTHGLDAQLPGGTVDANSDLAAVGD